jgi:uncharacterized protein
MSVFDPTPVIAKELGVAPRSVAAVASLLAEGSTVPFIARYRKEATGGLDEVQIRAIRDRREYLLELEQRRAAILESVREQGKLDPALARKLAAASTKTELEDLYAPFRPKRRTRAMQAKERGLEPLADRIWRQAEDGSPLAEARKFVDEARGVPDADAALAGARDICAERIADDAATRATVRDAMNARGVVATEKTKDKRNEVTKFDDYASFSEPLRRLAPHRYLAICRGENEKVLKVAVEVEDEARLRAQIEQAARVSPRSPWKGELAAAAGDALDRLLLPRAVADARAELKERAEAQAVDLFAKNLGQLLLAAPFGSKPVLGIDPGQRTGCKCAMVSATGQLVAHDTIYLVQGDAKLADAKKRVLAFLAAHRPAAIAVGNGTHGRETEAFVRDVLRDEKIDGPIVVSVSEAGASVYSASDVAREELPDIDVSIRGAVSIARRLQDPLAELTKIDPKSIGVGQYQHDVREAELGAKLDEVVEDCVNAVGVELNTASVPLLARVAGVGPKLAQRIVAHRDKAGAFKNRKELLGVHGLGPKTFEQAAGFLRIAGGAEPLDRSAVHPERYALVARIARDLSLALRELIGNADAVARIDKKRYLGDDVGDYTLDDILAELKKPGRDPRSSFEPPKFRDDVRTLDDLTVGMELEGVVTNVTDFGAFVDVGVKQDGLVHISQLADRFVKHPSDVVKVGDRLQVRVLSVELGRKRISLTAKRGAAPEAKKSPPPARPQPQPRQPPPKQETFRNNPFSNLTRDRKS